MYFWALIMLVTSVKGQKNSTGSELVMCDGVVFHGIYYDKEVLFKDLGRPYNLFMHKYSSELFFSHTIQMGSLVDFGVMRCNLEKRVCVHIPGVLGGYAIAYDNGNDDIYFGGHEGIYKYNYTTKEADYFSEAGKSIWSIFIRKNFFYIEYPTQKLHVYTRTGFLKVEATADIEIDNYFVSKGGEIYYSNKTALYKIESPQTTPFVLADNIKVRQIIDDSYGDIYFCANNGIFIEDKPYRGIKKIADFDSVFGMTFDAKEQVIYSDKNKIYRLVKNKYSRLCLDAIVNTEVVASEEQGFTNIIIS